MNSQILLIKNSSLALLLQEELKKGNNRISNLDYNEFTQEELNKITKLKINNSSIKDISELYYCTNLKELEISSTVAKKMANVNSKYRYDPINDYKFMQVAITDFSVIEKLSNLEYLKIENVTTIKNLDLSNLKKLYSLDLSNNQNLRMLLGLEKLNELSELKLYRNNIKTSIDLEKMLENNLNSVQLDFDLYPNLVNTNPNIYEVMRKYIKDGHNFKFSENLSGFCTNDILPIKMNEMHNKAQEILSKIIKDDYTDIEKIVAIYYYLIKHVTYDWVRLNASKNHENIYSKNGEIIVSGEKLETDYNRRNSSYNAIVEGRSVCEGYTNMMHYLLNMVGIESRTVSCNMDSENVEYVGYNSNHSIIRIKIDNDWYYFDPTNDGINNTIKYFFKTKGEISKTHKLSMDESIINDVENKSYTNSELQKIFNYIAGYSQERYIRKTYNRENENIHNMNSEQRVEYARQQLQNLTPDDSMYNYYLDIIKNNTNVTITKKEGYKVFKKILENNYLYTENGQTQVINQGDNFMEGMNNGLKR